MVTTVLVFVFGGSSNNSNIVELHTRMSYYSVIPPAPELGQTRKIDIARLRDVRKRLDTGYVSTEELETLAIECLDEIVELCSGTSEEIIKERSSFLKERL